MRGGTRGVVHLEMKAQEGEDASEQQSRRDGDNCLSSTRAKTVSTGLIL